jgi:predicted dehydrogenase
MIDKIIRWGIIGCGDVTERKSGPAFQKAEGSQLVAVMRRNGELARNYAIRHNVPKWYDDADLLITDPEVDAVYVATPPSTHKEFTIKAARAGKPVYVEKPMAVNYHECAEMTEECEKLNVPLFVAYYRRALPRFLKIKELIDEKAIGEVRAVAIRFFQKPSLFDLNKTYNWRVDPAIAGAGYFFDLASHTLDILQYYFGSIIKAEGSASNLGKYYEAEDTVSASLMFENGIHGSGLWCFCAGENLDKCEIIGSTGKIIFSTFGDEPVIVKKGNEIEELIIPHPEHIQQPLIQLIINELLGYGKSPSTGRTGMQTSWVMDKILGTY